MSFKQVIGQHRAIGILQSALVKDRLAHAYLFEGPPNVGKVFTALNFAKALNCLERPDGSVDCCDNCLSCRKIDAKGHIDVAWMGLGKGKSSISIEQVRQMQSRISLRPSEAKYKVFCVADADLASGEAQSALLKTLEEPPAKSIIILTTSSALNLFPTIVSRCQPIKFSFLKTEHLKDILAGRYHMKPGAAYFLARIAGSSRRIDISLQAKDEILNDKNRIIDEFNDFLSGQGGELAFLNKKKEDVFWALSVLLWWYRDILMLKETASGDNPVNKDRLSDLEFYAAKRSSLYLGEMVNIISKTADLLYETNANVKIALTVMTMDALNAESRLQNVSGYTG